MQVICSSPIILFISTAFLLVLGESHIKFVCATTLLSLNDFSDVGCLYLIYRLLQIFKIFDLDFIKINYENAKK